MANQFNSLEVLKMAMKIEKQGQKFYHQCVEANSNSEVKQLFAQLRDDEEEHYQLFKDMLEEFENNEAIDKDYLYDEEVDGYLASLVDTKVFPADKAENKEITTIPEQAIDIGIEAEKNSLLLYLELVDVEENEQAINALEKLIVEEKSHLTKLQNLKSKL